MNRQIVPLVAAALTLSLGTQARALPDLVADNTPPGWSFPSLPRSSGDATAVNCVLQAPPLPGESSNTWFNGTMRNIGPNSATGAFLALYLNDVLRTIQGPYNLASNAYNGFINYPSSVILKGGRHTLLSVADALGGVSETNESNNTWARQYIWSPMTLTPNSPVARSGDPNKFTIGSGPWMNLEGFVGETIINQWWYAFAAICTDGTTDFDVTLHTEVPSNVPQAGFAARTAFSAASGGHLDAVIIDKNHALPFTYYGGVARHSGSGDKVVQFEASPPGVIAGVGTYGPYTMGANDIIDLHEIYGFTSDVIAIEIRPISGAANVGASIIPPAASGMSTMWDAIPGGFADSAPGGGIEGMTLVLPADYHGLTIWKSNASDIAQSLTYNIVVSRYPNLVGDRTPSGWSGPIVPRNAPDAVGVATLPPTLNGNQATTSFNFSTYNESFLSANGPYYTLLSVDDAGMWFGFKPDPTPPHSHVTWMNTSTGGYQSIVRGGRHYLRSTADEGGGLPESEELDNSFADWFVWTPLELTNQVPVWRSAPPYAYPFGAVFPACDGFRTTAAGGWWTAVGVMPGSMSSEYDMFLHTPSSGSKDGFGGSLIWSFDTFPGNPDFCIVNYNAAPAVQNDYSVVNQWNYGDAFTVQQATAPYELYLQPGTSKLGPFTIDAQDILDMHEFYVAPEATGIAVYISVNNQSTNVDLELWLFDGTVPYHTKFTAMTGMNANGPGGDEHLPYVVFPNPGYFALVVNKSKATDMNLSGNYELVFATGQSAVDAPVLAATPTQFALSAPRPNPARAGTSVELAVPAGGEKATVDVMDLAGRRVRSLAQGNMQPGRHVLTWDGRDAAGRKVAAGVYFVRLETSSVHQSKKVTLLP